MKGLSQHQLHVLITATKHKPREGENQGRVFGASESTVRVLTSLGYIVQRQVATVTKNAELLEKRDMLIKEAKEELASGAWHSALVCLITAREDEQAATHTRWYITDAGRKAVDDS